MSNWRDLAHFLYGRGFWYADPLREIQGLDEEQLFWTPSPEGLCTLWQTGHIAHREGEHIERLLQGKRGQFRPKQYEVFGTDWVSTDDIRASIDSVDQVLDWVRDVRERSHAYIDSLTDDDWHRVPRSAPGGETVAQWVFITVAHTASHIGRIQLLRALIESDLERPC